MRTGRHVIVIVVLFIVALAVGFFQAWDTHWYKAIIFGILFLFVFNIVVKNQIAFKPYFTSRWNVFSTKYSRRMKTDLPPNLAFEKLLDLIGDSPYTLKYANPDTFEILITTGLSWKAWGENIYIDLRASGDHTVLALCSVAFFGIYAWGKNEDNIDDLVRSFEDSLTI